MTRRRTQQRNSNTQNKRNPLPSKRKFLQWSQVIIIVVLCVTAYILWLDYRIQTEFEGRRWTLPARVYAQPLELYVGKQLSPQGMEHALEELGYQKVKNVTRTGEYKRFTESIEVTTRTFKFWDSEELSRSIRIDFTSNTIYNIIDTSNSEPVPIIRLDPQLIGKIYPEHNEDRILLAYEDIPPLLIEALIAVEDRNYYTHIGIDLRGILRAAWINLQTGGLSQGGSTLTQQLVKNFFLSHERTLWRKLNEMIMAILLEHHYSKSEILYTYINEIYLGQHGARAIHGFGTAAEYYYSRPINELSTDQLALLVGLVRGASYYNPRRHHERAISRRNLVLTMMLEQGYLDKQQVENAKSARLGVTAKPGWGSAKYPAFLDLVRGQLGRDYNTDDLRSEGLRIFTTLNPEFQDIVDTTIVEQISQLERLKKLPGNVIEGAGVITKTDTGEVLALVGGRDAYETGFNRALEATRPIGSLIKPAVYLTALLQPEKFNITTLLDDAAINLKQADNRTWVPKNYDEKVHGRIPLYIALAKSYNLATVQLGLQLGISPVIKTLKKLGIESNIPEYPSLFLGAIELSPMQVTQMYQTLASGGFQIPLTSIHAVLDKDGNPLQRYPLDIKQTLDPDAVFLIKFLLSEVVNQGTAKAVKNQLPDLLPIAGKTGTTNDLRDSWFAGFGDDILGVIWLGRDDNQPAGMTGANGALKVWIEVMRKLRPAPLTLNTPPNVKWYEIHPFSVNGMDCTRTISIPYIQPYVPEQGTGCNNELGINRNSGNKSWSILDL